MIRAQLCQPLDFQSGEKPWTFSPGSNPRERFILQRPGFIDDCKTNVQVSLFRANFKKIALYQGTTSVVPKKASRTRAKQAAEKREFLEGDGLQAVHKCFAVNPALAAEGAAFAPYSTFFRSLFSPCGVFSLLVPLRQRSAGSTREEDITFAVIQ